MFAFVKRFSEPPIAFFLGGSICLALGVALCAVSQTILSFTQRMEVLTNRRLEFPSRIEQYNWDFHMGLPWLGLLIGIGVGLLLRWPRKSDLSDFDFVVRRLVSCAKDERPERIPIEWTSYWWLPCFIVFSFVVLTYFLHISSSAFMFGAAASSNAAIYPFQRRAYVAAMGQLAGPDASKQEKVATWIANGHRRAMRTSWFAAASILAIIGAAGAYARTTSHEFREMEAHHAERLEAKSGDGR